MNQILQYLQQNVDDNALLYKWDAKKVLNIQMTENYEFFCVSILETEFLLIRPLEPITIQKIKIHKEYIKSKSGFEVAVLFENSTPYRTKKMLEERIPFISIDKQMYLPFLALNIRQQQKQKQETEVHEKFTAATQLIYLYMLYENIDTFEAKELADSLHTSAMTVLRAMKELEQIGLISYDIAGQTGRKKIFRRICKKDYYSLGKRYLQNPVKKSIYVKYIPQSVTVLKSGLYALAEQTMLGEPPYEIYAADSKQEKEFHDIIVTKEQALEENLPKVQMMRYNVGLLTRQEYVDPISLIMSLNENDERIEMAIDELTENIEWFEA